ncbi:MAG: PDZ domain-containing protein [Deltaproteobacteria bacterium]|nr:PDZ domain-containing protein [Deltaproteobacteria bacterium]
MKRRGRSNSATGFKGYARPVLRSFRFLEEWSLKLPLVCTLTTLAVALAPALVFATTNAGPARRLSSDAVVYASSTDDSPDYSESPSSASTATLPSDSTAEPSVVPTPVAAVSKTEAVQSSPESAADGTAGAGTTIEIPQAAPSTATSAESTPGATTGPQAGSADYDDGIIRYEHAKDSEISGPPIGSLDDFMSEGNITSPLGIEVREDKRRLKTGGEAQGLLIVDVFAGSPAARAGLRPYHRVMRDALETAAVAGAMFCPPVVLLVPVFDQVRLGESYDLIIGVDGSRVINFMDFQDRLRDLQAGEIVYFSIIRNGERMQISVPVPNNLADPRF